jgi:hypothetical protein
MLQGEQKHRKNDYSEVYTLIASSFAASSLTRVSILEANLCSFVVPIALEEFALEEVFVV